MSVETSKFVRKSFEIEAVQVTSENMAEVAEWCDGELKTEGSLGEPMPYIFVLVHHPMNPRQSKAYVGDWVLYAGKGYKVYTKKAFEGCFVPAEKLAKINNAIAGIASPNDYESQRTLEEEINSIFETATD